MLLPSPHSTFRSECINARKIVESRGLLSMQFALVDDSPGALVNVTNRKSGLARQFPRFHWLVSLRDELHAGTLGRGYRVGARMQTRLDLAQASDERAAPKPPEPVPQPRRASARRLRFP